VASVLKTRQLGKARSEAVALEETEAAMKQPVLPIIAALTLGTSLSGWAAESDGSPCLPDVQVSAGPPQTFATHAQLASYGFLWGPSDGNFGAIPTGSGTYTFFGTAGVPPCRADVPCNGTFAFSGTLDRVTGGNPGKKVLAPGGSPAGWSFDRHYAGGGQIVRFDDREGHAGWLMSFHGEYHWKNPANPPGNWCFIGNTKMQVPCFYSGIGLALSRDRGQSFKAVGQILQPMQPFSSYLNGTSNLDVGYGSLIVADAHGRHLDNPPPTPSEAYFYLIFSDKLPAGASGAGRCANLNCMGVARAKYLEVIAAALSGDPHRVAKAFHKYDASSADPWAEASWSQPATGDRPDMSEAAGAFAPLWTDEVAPEGSALYDRSLDVYLIAYLSRDGIHVRASRDLIHWTKTIGVVSPPTAPASMYVYANLVGETGDPTIGGGSPRLYFSAFPVNAFPNYKLSTFEYVRLMLTGSRQAEGKCNG
jgi:hypothetical protein